VRSLLTVAAAASIVLFAARSASANGRFPASNQIVFSPSNANLVLVRTTYGILVSHDRGASWSFLCEDSLGLPPTAYEDPSLGMTASGALVAGLSMPTAGLDVSNDIGCTFNCTGGPVAHQSIVDIVVRADSAHVVLALASTFGDGGTTSQVFESTDDGADWAALGAPIDPAILLSTIDVAASDPHRIYVTGTRGYGTTRTASLLVSLDDGAHWAERAIAAFDPNLESGAFIGAVDPTNADRVYVRTSGQSRLLVTSDAGQSFQVAALALAGQMLGFAIATDGSKIYAGDKEDGLFVAARADLAFHKTSSVRVQCLATNGPELWACSDEPSGFIAGMSSDDGADFTAKLHICSATTLIACPAGPQGSLACGATANASQCGPSLQSVLEQLACTGDAGTTGMPGGASRAPSSRSSGCAMARDGPLVGLIPAGAALSFALRRRRRRRS
jgi:photosystem II stability/assembly factor-like uncharacterized protein